VGFEGRLAARTPGLKLQATHVTTQEDVNFYRRVYPEIVRREITDMTEEAQGGPWVFPCYYRNLVLMR